MDDKLQALMDRRFKGFATACGDMKFDLPVVSHIEGNLWTGASVGEFDLPMSPYFKSILNLYPWVKYPVPDGVNYREHELYDGHGKIDDTVIYELAGWVDKQPDVVLVHCQAGINRSNLVAATVLILRGYTPKESLDLIRKQRGPEALCNWRFEEWVLSQ
jgi:hypothetical protein